MPNFSAEPELLSPKTGSFFSLFWYILLHFNIHYYNDTCSSIDRNVTLKIRGLRQTTPIFILEQKLGSLNGQEKC